jgi:ankyrin repeat protein
MELDVKTQISRAMYRGDVPEVKRLFKEYPDARSMETGVGTWLHQAATIGNLEIVQACVAAGIDVNSPYPGGYPPETALFNAVGSGGQDVAVVQWLLEQGAKSDCFHPLEGVSRNFALNEAINQNRLDLVQLLVEHGANVNVYYNNLTPLLAAEAMKHKGIAKYLRSKGAKLPAELGLGPTAKKSAPKPKRKKN